MAPELITSVVACELGQHVQKEFENAKDARTSTDALLLACLRQRKGEYAPEELESYGSIATFSNHTSTICRAGEAWLDDVLASTRERPWSISPTPIPNVPGYIQDKVVEQIKKELEGAGIIPEDLDNVIRERAIELKEISLDVLQKNARAGTERMANKIADQLAEADFVNQFSMFRSDVITYPYAVLKGPVVRNKQRLSWAGSAKTPVVKEEAVIVVERVNPFDYYWAPWATNPNEGYIVELMRMEPRALQKCKGLKYFDTDKLDHILETYTQGHQEQVTSRVAREALEQNSRTAGHPDTIDVLDYWGGVRGEMLIEWGMVGDIEKAKTYEINAWVIDGVCIRAIMNPDPLGVRPYYVASYETVPGTIVGRSVPMLMRTHQEIINSAYRALRRNMGLASGPFAEVDQTRLSDGQAPEEILPAMVKLVEPDLTGGGQPVYRFHQIQSHANELLNIAATEAKACNEATGIPAYSYGNSAASGAGRTVGGLAMLMGNASKGIKKVIGTIERGVLEPLITSMYNYNMLYDEDETIKIDAQVVARGPTGIIIREARIQRQLEALQLITPYASSGVIAPEGIAVLLREVLTGLELPVDDIIPDPKRQQKLQGIAQADTPAQGQPGQPPVVQNGGQQRMPFVPEQMQGTGAVPAGRGTVQMTQTVPGQGTTPMAVPDGRSGVARQVVQGLNSV